MRVNRLKIGITELREGMILAEPIFDIGGKTLFSEGLKLNKTRIERILLLKTKILYIQVIPTANEKLKLEANIKEDNVLSDKQLIFNDTREEAAKIVKYTFNGLMDSRSIKSDKITSIVENIIDAILKDDKVILNLSNLSLVDDYIFSHSVNVCVLSLIMGIYLGFNHQKLLSLGSGALIHDIGKILVPKSILNKPGKLTEDEYEIAKMHTVYGHKILRDKMGFPDEISMTALSHHERIDGNGYPNKLEKSEISKFAKIVGIADVFDAVTSDRAYCGKIDYYKAVEYLLKNSDTQFDSDIVNKFVTIIGYYPIGLYVQLNTGDIGMVITKNKLFPVIKITVDSNGIKLNNYYEIDLHKNPSISIVYVNIEEYNIKRP